SPPSWRIWITGTPLARAFSSSAFAFWRKVVSLCGGFASIHIPCWTSIINNAVVVQRLRLGLLRRLFRLLRLPAQARRARGEGFVEAAARGEVGRAFEIGRIPRFRAFGEAL